MALTASQRQILNVLVSRARAKGASPKVTKALIEAGLVESNLSNPRGGDRDSQGVLQQRPSQGWGTSAQVTDPGYAADKFIAAAGPLRGKYGTAGALAQAVQRSAFPERYQQRSGEAASLIGRVSGGAPVRAASSPAPAANPDPTNVRGQLIAQFLSEKNPDVGAFATSIGTLNQQAAAAPKAAAPTQSSAAPAGKLPTGVGSFEGKKVAAWIVPALTYARKHGWKGTVTSGYRSFADQQRIYDSGVRPAAKPGTSNHEGTDFPRGAIDATDAGTLSRILKASPYASKLIYAGTKDPVHFSHPHAGSY